jgi:hypothetical protein
MMTYVHLWSHLVNLFLYWEMFETKFVEQIKTNFVFNNFFFKSYCLWDNAEKKATGHNMAHAHCVLDN